MYIETPRMIIRDFVPEDAADLHEIFGDDETMENCEPAYDFDKAQQAQPYFRMDRDRTGAAALFLLRRRWLCHYLQDRDYLGSCSCYANRSTV